MTQWFRFVIPLNEDGSRVTYSPNWAGTMPKCPQDVTVLLYNDKEGYGIAQTADKFVPKEVTVLSDKEAKKILDSAKDEDEVYFGVKLDDRWKPEPIVEVIEEPKPLEEVYLV